MGLILHVGLDDTDSLSGGCTTYIAALLVERLSKLEGLSFLDYPNLIRLNPNIPWKTRGNGALCLRLCLADEGLYEKVQETALDLLRNLQGEGFEPGLAFLKGRIPEALKQLAFKAEWTVVDKAEALSIFHSLGGETFEFEGGRGVVGAIAAIGETLEGDHTYELLAYRKPEFRGLPRRVSPESVFKMDEAAELKTFGNVDSESGRILVTPRGPDPVLFGVRGETFRDVVEASRMLEVKEPVERWMVFRSNQGTDSHLKVRVSTGRVPPYSAVIVEGRVSARPQLIPGGHVLFEVDDGTGRLACAVYEPTGSLVKAALQLSPGDRVRLYGGLRKAQPFQGQTLNVEKFEVLEVSQLYRQVNPSCPKCGKRMKSMGAGKGYRCPRCGFRDPKAVKVQVQVERALKPGLYFAAARAHRHLTKPPKRYGLEKPFSPEIYLKLKPKLFWGLGWPPPPPSLIS
ncbi:MAG: TiaS agmantine-binding domain-containing protein [Candidatus Hecatellaceae archaeon]